ncbi:MAG: HlyD family efflux transporter periplasmic adaptor subunit [Clostridia bacterium]|nr:HlyD family efflux transporter periplasmic adaptor subunit [Clostridia bacterium]MBR3137591.1 HlyD family efflux transporter periplasmic adaptor subunit [Clostridia bacterium]
MKERKGTFWKILLTLLILGGLGYGGWYAYGRFFAEVPQEGTVFVQSVATITGVGAAGVNNRYSGVVEAKNIVKVDPDKNLTVEECLVAAGDKVQKGTPLFRYDVESMKLSHEQLLLDILGLENSIRTSKEKVETLNNQLQRARENKKYDIQMNIQTEELEIRKKEYELSGKRKQAEDMEKALDNSTIYSSVEGTIRSVKSADNTSIGYDYGVSNEDNAYITIVAGNDYCVKGTVSEQTIRTLQEGMPVRVTSRVDDQVWMGHIYRINTEETKQNNNYYYYESSGEKASKYEFFVELESIEGLLMGQHVYIEAVSEETGKNANVLMLPGYYVVLEEDSAFVYAVDSENKIEKRYVTLGDTDDENGIFEIVDGLSFTDRIAFPDETVQVGMNASETSFVPENLDSLGDNTGMEPSEEALGGPDA